MIGCINLVWATTLATTQNVREAIPLWRGRALRIVIALLVVQLAYWLAIRPVLFVPPPPRAGLPIENARIATISEPTLAAAAQARFKPVKLPADDCCGPGYRAFEVDLMLDSVPERGLGVVWQVNGDNGWLAVNGKWVRQPGRILLPDITYDGNVKGITLVPAGLLQPGRNTLTGIHVRDGGVPWFDFHKPLIGAHDQLVTSTRQVSFLRNEYKLIAATIAGVMALLAAVLAVASRGSAFALWVAVLFAAWGLRMVYYMWTDPPFAAVNRLTFYFVVTILIPVAWLQAANEWTGQPWRWLRWFGVTVGIGLTGFVIWQIHGRVPDGYDLAGQVVDIAGMALGVMAVVRFVWHVTTQPEGRYWEVAILALGVTVSAVGFYQFFTGARVSDNLETILPLLAVGFAVAFFERNVTLFRSTDDLNAHLAEKLTVREAELAENYRQREALGKRETLIRERQRLMRDMHDGIGGQLMSLLFAVRQKRLPPEELAASLQDVIDELRLIIDSMDTVGESLSAALASFRGRIEPRLRAAGIDIVWSNQLPDDLPELPPRTVLQVFRIVQEATTNAIKHSRANVLTFAIGLASTHARSLEIKIADAGKGFAGQAANGGRGLDNMAARAAAIGGNLRIETSAEGTVVTLTLPLIAQERE